jgi:hypothetical protein
MLKPIRSIIFLGSVVLSALGGILPAHAQDVSTQTTVGICGLYYVSGRSVVDSSGRMVSLVDYCRVQVAAADAPGTEGEAFWQAFVAAASPRALEFAQSVGREKVIAYGSTICPYFQGGGTMQELRRTQSRGSIPVGFEAAVTVAAINTYCPEYRSEVARF